MNDKTLIFATTHNSNVKSKKAHISLSIVIVFAFIFLCLSKTSFAQEKPDNLVPPPLNVLTKNEKKLLKEETKPKKRTKLALELMETRLLKSKALVDKNKYRGSLDELGGFQALVRNTLKYLKGSQRRKASVKNFKRFEMTLREFIPQLELIRRDMPVEYSYHVREMIKFVRTTRGKAIEPLYGDTVLREGS